MSERIPFSEYSFSAMLLSKDGSGHLRMAQCLTRDGDYPESIRVRWGTEDKLDVYTLVGPRGDDRAAYRFSGSEIWDLNGEPMEADITLA